MKINDYIEKLRRRSHGERRKIAMIATGVSFAFILLIWIVSFGEMNKSVQPQAEDPAMPQENISAANNNSIEQMFQGDGAASDATGDSAAGDSSSGDLSGTDANSADVGGSALDNVDSGAADSGTDQNNIDDGAQNPAPNGSDNSATGQIPPQDATPPAGKIPPLP